MKNSAEDYLYPLGLALLAALAGWKIFDLAGVGRWDALLPGCCGGTRAMRRLLAGHPLQSFVCHPAVPYLAFTGAWFMLSQTAERLSKGRLPVGMRYRDVYMWIGIGLFALQFVLRNLLKQVWGITIPDM